MEPILISQRSTHPELLKFLSDLRELNARAEVFRERLDKGECVGTFWGVTRNLREAVQNAEYALDCE